MTIRVIDTETTGYDPSEGAELIEIASLDLKSEGHFENTMQDFVKPQNVTEICPTISAVTGIIYDDVKDGLDKDIALRRYSGADFYVAHNNRFDMQFLPDSWGPWIDTMRCSAHVWPEAPSYSNQTLRYYLGLIDPLGIDRTVINPHRALADVYVTAAIASELIKQVKFTQLLEWSIQPMILRKFPFGKHQNKPFTEVPGDYFDWFLGQADPKKDEDVIFNIRQEIDRRNGQ